MKNKVIKTDAVSPVIGVILMVAIVVILAAVIAAFIFGMAGSNAKEIDITITDKFVCERCDCLFFCTDEPQMLMIETSAGEYYEVRPVRTERDNARTLWDSFIIGERYTVSINFGGDIEEIIRPEIPYDELPQDCEKCKRCC